MRLARLTHHVSRITHRVSLFTAIALLLASASVALAQVSANYDLSWHVIAGGGGQMQSAGHTAIGSIGQPLVGTMATGGGHALCSGFWCGALAGYRIYLPLVLRNHSSTSMPIFSDNFNTGTLTGWTSNGGTWTNPGTYMRGEYTLGNAWNMRASTGSNIAYTGTVNLLSGNAAGLTFRSSANGTSSYDVILDAVDDVFKISRRPPYQILASYPTTVQYNHPYTIKVVASGSTIEAYLDGVKRLTATDTTYSGGYLGAMLFQAAATYDDLQAWQTP